jgi:hypothetical protein
VCDLILLTLCLLFPSSLPAAGFGAGTYDAKDDDTYESCEVEVSRTYASVRDLGACSQVQALNMHPDQILPPSETEDFDFEECDDSD